MRLLTVGSLPPEWGGPARGGVATFHAALLEGFRPAGEEIEVVGVFSPAPLGRGAPVPVFERPTDVPIAAFYEGLLERLRPDVVLMNHVAHTVGVTHARLSAPPPAVGIAHSWHNITYAPPEEVERRHEVTAEAIGGLAALVTGSRHAMEEGRRLGLRYPSRAEAIHYPLQPTYLEAGVEVDSAERRGVLFLGSLIPRKNPEALVKAAGRLPGVPVVLAGEGELEPILRESISELGLADRVSLVGHFPPAEHLRRVRDLLLGAEVMCLPSRSESFGLAYIEALACGTPIVGFGPTVGEIRDAMGIEVGEALDDPSPGEIAAAIERVTASSWDRELLRRAAIDTFGLSRVSERYIELLGRASLESSMA
ncbi:MAG TPA: glycosyltransferase family 4 protein [Solirubrobacterales bacterium]|nr:glycosyltransferase family 4 protein [Solirubrobacterales bacterium]